VLTSSWDVLCVHSSKVCCRSKKMFFKFKCLSLWWNLSFIHAFLSVKSKNVCLIWVILPINQNWRKCFYISYVEAVTTRKQFRFGSNFSEQNKPYSTWSWSFIIMRCLLRKKRWLLTWLLWKENLKSCCQVKQRLHVVLVCNHLRINMFRLIC